nr:hypothetical protein B0A51_15458 [Rachicladosporium sp. CCFEE 5018]
MAAPNTDPSPFPAASKTASGIVDGLHTNVGLISFSDKILLTITSLSAPPAHWVHVPLAANATDPMNPGHFPSHDTENDLLPMTHLTATTVLGGTKRDEEVFGQTLATTIGSAILMQRPGEERMLVVGLGLKGVSTMGRPAFEEVIGLVLDLPDIILSQPHQHELSLHLESCTLRYLSIVDVDHIPLHIFTGARYDVSTRCAAVESFFTNVLASGGDDQWWNTRRHGSSLGILVAVEHSTALSHPAPRITELLFIATRDISTAQTLSAHSAPPLPDAQGVRPDLTLAVTAQAISSDLLHPSDLPTPPSSSTADPGAEVQSAIFLTSAIDDSTEVVHEPPTKKRRTANDAFDEANERRRAARRKGGQAVSAAASIGHRRESSGGQILVPLQTRPLSRSPSVIDSRPPTAVDGKRRSTLSRVESVSALPSPSVDSAFSVIHEQNKVLVQRTVMTCMRAYGWEQARADRRSKSDTQDHQGADTTQNNEYKLVYHQTYKGVCCAFRAHMSETPLSQYAAILAETADKLLAIFLADPVASGFAGHPDKLTPGGRKLFGAAKTEEQHVFVGHGIG